MKKNITIKGFSLVEVSIVLIILALLISVLIPYNKSNLEIKKIEISNSELRTIKYSLIGHMAVRGNLPKSDSNGDGIGDSSGLGDLPYLDLNLKPYDKYGMPYKYDPSDLLLNSDESNVCSALSDIYSEIFDINNSTEYPQMVDESNNTQYVAAAVVISKGLDKVLTGINSSGNRKYDREINSYDIDTRNDLVVEFSAREFLITMCEEGGGAGGEEPVVRPPFTIVAIGDVNYNSDVDPTCRSLLDNESISTYAYEVLTFYQSGDTDCSNGPSKQVSMTYAQIDAMDVDPDDNIVNVIEERNGGQPPTMSDN